MGLFSSQSSQVGAGADTRSVQYSRLDQMCYGYLLIPLFIFCLGWLNLGAGLAIAAILGWIVWRNRHPSGDSIGLVRWKSRSFWIGIGLLGLWVLLSGIGGYAFQNYDHHIRNAIFQDLVSRDWPVLYPPVAGDGQVRLLVYYVGYWLPAALVGKTLGQAAASAFLFLWTWIGVSLAALQIARRLKARLVGAAVLLIFFSGMDVLGVIFIRQIFPNIYPTLWPPIQHLEWWAPSMQFSSNTTQLFWVFNQAVPIWVGLGLLVNDAGPRRIAFLWSLCFFYAPLPALGMFPLAAARILRNAADAGPGRTGEITRWKILGSILGKCFSLDNLLGGGIVFLLSFLYFSSNQNIQQYGWLGPDRFAMPFYLVFVLLEGGILWWLVRPGHRRDPDWYLVGGMLFLFPLFVIGTSTDFAMRASIPALFYLMIWVGKSLSNPRKAAAPLILFCLILGALTPIYEINRSLYRTVTYRLQQISGTLPPPPYPIVDLADPYQPETDHPLTLTADELSSLQLSDPSQTLNFIGHPSPAMRWLGRDIRGDSP